MNFKKKELVYSHFPIIVTLAYFIFVATGMYFHELWRDELDIYARVFYNEFLKYNGTSGPLEFGYLLYYNFLHVLVNLFPYFTVYQTFHLIIITLAIYIFNKYSPFSLLQKIFFTFSYFMIFDYGIISRWYGFFVLLVFVITYFITRKKLNYILISILILILANHNISSAIFGVSFALYIIIHIINRYPFQSYLRKEKINLVIASIIFITGSILIIIQYCYSYKYQSNTFEMLGHSPLFMSIRNIWNAYVPIPDLNQNATFWNTNIIPYPLMYPSDYDITSIITIGNLTSCFISIIIILICLLIFSKKLPVLLSFVFTNITYFIFMHFVFRVYFIRYLGLYFIAFVCCCWLYCYSDDFVKIPFSKKELSLSCISTSYLIKNIYTNLITIVFLAQFIGGLYVYPRSIQYQFTKAWDAADYIKRNISNDYLLIGAIDYAVLPISIILNRDIYFPQTQRCSKILEYWGANRKPYVDMVKLLYDSIYFLVNENKRIVIILNYQLKDNNGNPISESIISNKYLLVNIINFEGDIIQSDEQYYLYELKRI